MQRRLFGFSRSSDHQAETWVLISWYLSATAIFYAAVLVSNTEKRHELIVHGTTLPAIVASLAGIIGFFHLIPGLSDAFLRYDRASGAFNDPNVLGAFLVFPALIALQRVLVGRFPDTVRNASILIVFIYYRAALDVLSCRLGPICRFGGADNELDVHD
jgi:hypothetical protein